MASSSKGRWIWFPPFFSVFLLIIMSFLGRAGRGDSLPSIVWGVFLASYICLCSLSAFFIVAKETRYNLGIFLLSQGLLLSFVSPKLGLNLLGWLGFIVLLIGIFIGFYQATNESEALSSMEGTNHSEVEDNTDHLAELISKISLPICITNTKGIIIGMNAAFSSAVGRTEESILKEAVSDILPIDQEETEFASGHWWIAQNQQGKRHFFTLYPTEGCLPPKNTSSDFTPSVSSSGSQFIDAETGLYTSNYQDIRVPEELERSRRYRRWLSAGIVSLEFSPPKDSPLSEQHKQMLFNAFATRVKEALRSVDAGFLMKNQRILILLPETAQSGAKTFMGRILTIPQDVFDDDIRDHVHPTANGGIFFYNGTPPMEYEVFMGSLEEALANNTAEG